MNIVDYNNSFGNDMTFDEKNLFWSLIFDKVSNAIEEKQDFAIIFNLSEKGMEDLEGHSIIIQKDDYNLFIKNFLLWTEENERYEECIEAQKKLNQLILWQKEN